MTTTVPAKGRIRIYCCGGGGINIGARFERHRGKSEVGFAQIEATYVDTSRSNLHNRVGQADCYLMDGLDGSGKVRAENYEEISSRIRDILQSHKPADLNIVLSTGAGGSGSVIAPSLVGELLLRDLPTIVICIGSSDTRLEAENTLKTLKSYESIAKLRNAPVVMAYAQNDSATPRSKVDAYIESLITSLCALYSRENQELDSRDLFNWLRFERVTTFPVQLAALTLIDKESDLSDLGNIISVATIATEEASTSLSVMPEYQCVGFLPTDADKNVLKNSPLHFVTSDGVLTEVATKLQRVLADLDQAKSARIKKPGVLSISDQSTDTGLVL